MTKNCKAASLIQYAIKLLLMLVLGLFSFSAHAQLVSPAVTDSHSYSYSQNGVFIDMSIGELAVVTLEGSSQIITQGFLQPIKMEHPCDIPDLVYYPNPVVDIITIKATECDVYVKYVEAYDLFGKSVLVTDAYENTIDLTPIGVGVYMLRIFADNSQLLGTIKIIKISV